MRAEWEQFALTGSVEAYLNYRQLENDRAKEQMRSQEGQAAAKGAGMGESQSLAARWEQAVNG